jgi:hypothetical protein
LEGQRTELENQRELLSRHLEDVVERFSASRDDVINQFLALEPLFSATRLRPRENETSPEASAVLSGHGAQPAEAAFTLPPFACEEPHSEPWPEIGEVEFYERFRKHVKGSGYLYRDVDLASFHLSVKCSDMTVLGGVSGTGKSSLPRLYVEALAGYDVAGSGRYLNVAVSPSWLDMRDLLGHVNTLEGRFQPSEAGIHVWPAQW